MDLQELVSLMIRKNTYLLLVECYAWSKSEGNENEKNSTGTMRKKYHHIEIFQNIALQITYKLFFKKNNENSLKAPDE